MGAEPWFSGCFGRQRSDEHPYKFAPDEFVDAFNDVGIAFWGTGIVFEIAKKSLRLLFTLLEPIMLDASTLQLFLGVL